MSESFCRRMPRYLPCDLLREIRERYGIGALFTGEAVLFGWCFAFTFLSDLYSVRYPAEGSALGFLCCAAAFGLCREGPFRAVLKYGYLVCALFCGGPWLVTACFLWLFEHIPTALKTEKR